MEGRDGGYPDDPSLMPISSYFFVRKGESQCALLRKLLRRCGRILPKRMRKRIALQRPTPGITQVTDIAYLPDGHRGHLLDVYYPEGTAEPLPVVIDIHGGGLMYGYKELNKYYILLSPHGDSPWLA